MSKVHVIGKGEIDMGGGRKPRPRRQRKPSLKSTLAAARKAGASDATIRPDGTIVASFGTITNVPQNTDVNPWDVELEKLTKGEQLQ